MAKLYILSIDSDEDYRATLHANVEELGDALADWTQAYGYEHQLDDTDAIVEWLQDHGVEVNITEADAPTRAIPDAPNVEPDAPPADPLADVWDSVEKLTVGLRRLSAADVTLSEHVDNEPEPEHPHTGYGARVTFADGTGYDIDNVDAVQIHDKAANAFPFGFVDTEEGHKPVFWAAEDGRMHEFSAVDAPKPFEGW